MKRRICLAWFGDLESAGPSPRGKSTASREPAPPDHDVADTPPKSKAPIPEPPRTTIMRKH